jgi:hypothetical protein
MTTKTLKSSQKEFMNDAVRGLVNNLAFLGDTTGQSSIFQGTNFGYQSGGGPPYNNVIQKFPFASDANATDVSDLTSARSGIAGQSSSRFGYSSGGSIPGTTDIIDKFLFFSGANATNVGDLTLAREFSAGQSSDANGYGYTSGGSGYSSIYDVRNIIDKFPFAADTNATDIGNLTIARSGVAGQSSQEYGYSCGGMISGPPQVNTNVIDKFPFSADANATDVGDLTITRETPAGQSSDVSGYSSGGYIFPPPSLTASTVIDKFPFSSNANATDVGDLTLARYSAAGQSSTVSGYSSGGALGAPVFNVIDKFPFATDANATDVGDLFAANRAGGGQQY